VREVILLNNNVILLIILMCNDYYYYYYDYVCVCIINEIMYSNEILWDSIIIIINNIINGNEI